MSDLSFLIETQNQVVIDQKYLQEYQHTANCIDINEKASNNPSVTKTLSSRDIKIANNKSRTQLKLKNKSSLQKSFKNLFSANNGGSLQPSTTKSSDDNDKEELMKIQLRIEALEQNQQRMEQKIGVEFFQMREEMQKKNREQNEQIEEVKKIDSDLNQTKRKIGDLLTLITKKSHLS